MNYLIGDIQGCCGPLQTLLDKIDFSPSRDHVYLLGDLVNRGPASLETLRLVQKLGSAASSLLGNHDLHLLAMANGVRKPHKGDTISEILNAPDREALIQWVRQQRMAIHEHGWLMVHAGVVPQWDLTLTLSLAAEVEELLQSPALPDFLQTMYGDEPDRWSAGLTGYARAKFAINALTRLRFCDAKGRMDFKAKDGAETAPAGFMPWFDVPGRKTAGVPIAFGHWSTLGFLERPDLLSLDTGCVWGGKLTAVRIDDGQRELIQVDCEQAQKPS